jgi:hypothetical protein
LSEEVKTKRDKEELRENPLSEAMSEPKTPTSQETKPVREIDEQTQKHIDRFLQGKEVWNKWANEMLAKKEELEIAGLWKVQFGIDRYRGGRVLSADNSIPEIQEWLDETFIDFSNLIFKCEGESDRHVNNKKQVVIPRDTVDVFGVPMMDFRGFKFPSLIKFINCEFLMPVSFTGSVFYDEVFLMRVLFKFNTVFYLTVFKKNVAFSHTEFKSEVEFLQVEFKGHADFDEVKFIEKVDIIDCHFFKEVNFEEAAFRKDAVFNVSCFYNEAKFLTSDFHAFVDFTSVRFNGNANFKHASFESHADYSNVMFHKKVNFEAAFVNRSLNLAGAKFFSNVPNISQTNFLECPRLDHIEVLPAPKIKSPFSWQRYFWQEKHLDYLSRLTYRLSGEYPKYIWNKFTNTRREPDEEAQYRALKRLAIQAHDHENEMKFFAGEIRARRHITDFMWPWKKGIASSARYWAGVFYEAVSDFGRSFIRPIAYWCITFFIFANLTLSGAGLEDKTKCHNSQLSPKEAAYTIGLKNSLLILGLTKTIIVKQAELCLYGLNKNGANKNGEANSKPKTYNPKIKRTYQTKSTKTNTTIIKAFMPSPKD